MKIPCGYMLVPGSIYDHSNTIYYKTKITKTKPQKKIRYTVLYRIEIVTSHLTSYKDKDNTTNNKIKTQKNATVTVNKN